VIGKNLPFLFFLIFKKRIEVGSFSRAFLFLLEFRTVY